MEQRRHFGRIPFGATTFLELDGQKETAALIDISLKGALLQFDDPVQFAEGSSWQLSVPLSNDVVLSFSAEVVHCDSHRAGLKFTALDTVTFGHLVRLLELNTGDPAQIEGEMRFLTKKAHSPSD